jgi:hypothetical protein
VWLTQAVDPNKDAAGVEFVKSDPTAPGIIPAFGMLGGTAMGLTF